MAPYFFFDGEQAETFSSEANNKMVAATMRDILGCTIIETAMEDLGFVARTFGKALGDLPGETEIREREQQIEAAQLASGSPKGEIARLDETLLPCRASWLTSPKTSRCPRSRRPSETERRAVSRMGAVQQSLGEVQSDILKWISGSLLRSFSSVLPGFARLH